MPILNNTCYSYNDISIIPSCFSTISSRSECNPYYDKKLPIFASPMSTITNLNNIDIWKNNAITPIIPRNISYHDRYVKMYEGEWVALSLKEFKNYFVDSWNTVIEGGPKPETPRKDNTFKICVDLANGHMKSLYDTINQAKYYANENDYKLIIMTGNIANPATYGWICANADVDYIRLSIGTGNNCITTSNTAIHYPIASLIDECYKIKNNITGQYISKPKIVADGGIRGYSDVIKALGLGADYVMIGSLFTGLLESAAPLDIECYNSHYKYSFKEDGTINDGINDILNIWDPKSPKAEDFRRQFIKDMKSITKESYGMSTKKAQMLINPYAKTKTSEGCTKYITVKETVHQWTDNMIAYLKSAMSYCDCRTIYEFIGQVNIIVNSGATQIAVNK